MKKFFLMALCVLPLWALSQFNISGKVSWGIEKQALPHAHISVENTYIVVFSDMKGNYKISNLSAGKYVIKCSFIGHETFVKEVNLETDLVLDIMLNEATTLTDEVIISATRSSERMPIAKTTITKEALNSNNLGADLPILLKMTPSIIVTSDAGTGVGYTGVNIRGSDPTRINITINGIPVNDSESHGVWWVNMPDFASSVENIEIQRGVGTSSNGAAAFGASINLQTNTLNEKRYAEISNAIGSFNTMKNTLRFGTGLNKNKWAFDGRVSHVKSDGYIDRASSKLFSYYFSGGYYGKKNILKMIHFSGNEKTYQAWYGAPKDSLKENPTFNPAGIYYDANGNVTYYDNETDNYKQDHYQLHFSHQLNENVSFNLAGHYTKGAGYYEQYRQNDKFSSYNLTPAIIGGDTILRTDLIRQRWLDNHFYGAIYGINYNSFSNFTLTLGGGYNIYDGDHFGNIIWAEISKNTPHKYRYYDNNGFKKELNNYLKAQYQMGKLNVFGDIQHRHITYDFLGKAIINNQIEDLGQTVLFSFINPKFGFNYNVNHKSSFYGFLGISNREPVRKDFTESSQDSRPTHETLQNVEIGYKVNMKKIFLGANVYLMNYKNQLVLTGKINDVGDYTRKNIDGSYRRGIELETGIRITDKLNWGANLTLSQNIINDYKEFYDVYDSNWDWIGTDSIVYNQTNISFSPAVIAASILSYKPHRKINLELLSKYVGKQYIDNTSNDDRALDAYFVNDFKISYKSSLKFIEELECILLVNNILNTNYITHAWVYNGILTQGHAVSLADGYFPQAGRHFMLGLNLRF